MRQSIIKPFILTVLFLCCLLFFTPVFAEDGFHSEFGWLPPEIPENEGLLSTELARTADLIDQEGLPPSHRQRRVYEWIMQTIDFDVEIEFHVDLQDDTEAVYHCVTDALQEHKTGDAGFALLAHYLLQRIGLESVILRGELIHPDGSIREHRWNYVYFSGKWYHFDPLAEMLHPGLNGFMNVSRDLEDTALLWDPDALPESADYPVRALGCDCDF